MVPRDPVLLEKDTKEGDWVGMTGSPCFHRREDMVSHGDGVGEHQI